MQIDWSIITEITRGRMFGRPATAYCGVSTDTRSIQPGQMYVALEGERFDGHTFVGPGLAERGCPVLVRRGKCPDYMPRIEVDDPLTAMQALAGFARSQFTGPVAAITGSHGKTTTKDILAAILSQTRRTHSTYQNLNGLIGVPLTLLGMPPNTEAVVVEVGISKPGEMHRLAPLVHPTLAIVTCIAPAHSEFLPSLSRILREKWVLVDSLQNEGIGLINADDPLLRRHAGRPHIRTFGLVNGDYRAHILSRSRDHQKIRIHEPSGDAFEISINLPGSHNVYNATAAVAAARIMGISVDSIRTGLANTVLSPHRARIINRNGITLIDDAYNAAPRSMESALSMLSDMSCEGRRIAVLGDMLELGSQAVEAHLQLAVVLARLDLDQVLAFGPLMEILCESARTMGVGCRHFPDQDSLLEYLRMEIRTGDVVLIKASRSMQAEHIVNALVNG